MSRNRFTLSIRRLPRQPVFRVILLFLLVWDSIHLLALYWRQLESINLNTVPPPNTKRIYIAAQHWNSARLLRSTWNAALLDLVQELGIDNVFVSIYESGSYDDTKSALRELDTQLDTLNVRREIVLSDVSHAQEITKQSAKSQNGWITTRSGSRPELRRIPFLASLRNLVLKPLEDLTAKGTHFDTILFLNDVVFKTEDVLRLLDTNGGDYAAACSLDFMHPPYFYDTFALRDDAGHEAVMQTWPYFRSRASRFAAERFLPVPVRSCWNGMVAMPIEPFTGESPLRFRGISDSIAAAHIEGSECCLIHADNPLSTSKSILVNPAVKVGYNSTQYDKVHAQPAGMSALDMYTAIWKSRVLRWSTTPLFKEWIVRKRMEKMGETDRGAFCLVNEMQILTEKGWKHV